MTERQLCGTPAEHNACTCPEQSSPLAPTFDLKTLLKNPAITELMLRWMPML